MISGRFLTTRLQLHYAAENGKFLSNPIQSLNQISFVSVSDSPLVIVFRLTHFFSLKTLLEPFSMQMPFELMTRMDCTILKNHHFVEYLAQILTR